MENQISFSIILPVYNRETTINRSLKSALSQQHSKFEVIIVDDGSTDNTRLILDSMISDSRMKVIHKENGGVCSARNHGLEAASNEYILFLDSDDQLEPNTLINLENIIKESDLPDIVCFGYIRESNLKVWKPANLAQNQVKDRSQINLKIISQHLHSEKENDYYLTNYVWNKCYRSEFINSNELGFETNRRVLEDGRFVMECLLRDPTIITSDKVFYRLFDFDTINHLSDSLPFNSVLEYISDEDYYQKMVQNKLNLFTPCYINWNANLVLTFLQNVSLVPSSDFINIINKIKESNLNTQLTRYKDQIPLKSRLKLTLLNGSYPENLFLYYLFRLQKKIHS